MISWKEFAGWFSPRSLREVAQESFTRRKCLKAGGWFLYGCLIFLVVFWGRYNWLRLDALAREGLAGLKGVRVEFPRLEPQLFPPRVFLDSLRIVSRQSENLFVEIRDVEVRLSFLPLLIGKVEVLSTGRMFGGTVRMNLASGALFDTDRISVNIESEMMELHTIPSIRSYDNSLRGYLSCNMDLYGRPAAPEEFQARVVASLVDLDMENRFPIVKGTRFKGVAIDIECEKEGKELRFSRLDVADGKDISLKLAGVVRLDLSRLDKSQLDLTGRFLGNPERLAASVLDPKVVKLLKGKQAVPLVVKGRVQKPDIRLR